VITGKIKAITVARKTILIGPPEDFLFSERPLTMRLAYRAGFSKSDGKKRGYGWGLFVLTRKRYFVDD